MFCTISILLFFNHFGTYGNTALSSWNLIGQCFVMGELGGWLLPDWLIQCSEANNLLVLASFRSRYSTIIERVNADRFRQNALELI